MIEYGIYAEASSDASAVFAKKDEKLLDNSWAVCYYTSGASGRGRWR